jgi:sterol desaturase/sphingolipid hydroxylase (fatty acid hydroxylase superfamily)
MRAIFAMATNHETLIRLMVFAAVLTAMAWWEAVAPRRLRSFSRAKRWPANLAIATLGIFAVRIILPLGALGFASFCTAHGWGLLNVIRLPRAIAVIGAVIALDFAIYLQHVVFHALPVLWRFHRMHHTDLDLDVTSGVRFHPVESVISMAIKLAAIAVLGPPVAGVFAFEVLLNASSLFNHSNVAIAPTNDALMRLLICTPDMHRVHHSIVVRETNSNFGFNLPWWDRLFGTYCSEPAAGQIGMTIGIEQFREADELGFIRMMIQPWREASREYPGNRA